MSRQYYVYIMTNRSGTLYIGVTNELVRRVHEHKTKCIEGFTSKYNLTQLVYYEAGADIRESNREREAAQGLAQVEEAGTDKFVQSEMDRSQRYMVRHYACTHRA